MWLKYRFKWNSGIEDEWSYQLWSETTDDELIKEYLNELEYTKGYCYDDHYRGYEHELVKIPPLKYLQQELAMTKDKIKKYKLYELKLITLCNNYKNS